MSKGQIVFFDATEVRREKMRNAAMGVKESKAVNNDVEFVDKNVVPPMVEPAKKVEVKVEKPEVKSAGTTSAPKAAASATLSPEFKKELESALIAFVVEQTGYPEDMVDMDADLEGDLGIDSIKKAQLMGELNEKYHFVDVNSPADSSMSLDDFPTLGSIRDFLFSKAGGSAEGGKATTGESEVPLPKAAPQEESAPAPRAAQIATNIKGELQAALINFVVEQTGYPEDMVDMDADLEGDLGIDSIKKAQLMGELNEKYHFVDVNSPADSDMSLDDFPTLGSILDYLLSKTGESVSAPALQPETKTEKIEEVAQAPVAASKPVSSCSINKSELEAALVNFVVEQTGYPEDMVDMDADLEGDLGIDSIKKAQLMGELNEKYHFVDVNSPADSDMSLDDFPTLGSIRDYLLGKSTDDGAATAKPETKIEPAAAPQATSSASINVSELEAALVNFVVEQTGYPEDMIDMDADLEGDLGIDSIKKAQLMGELNEKYHFVDVNSPADSDMSLDDFPTLGSIRDYLVSKTK